MEHKEYWWQTADGYKIYAQSWQPHEQPKAVIALVHGMSEHSSRFENWAGKFVCNQYALIAFDARGHGLSEGKRGYTPSYKHIMNDIAIFIQQTKLYFPNLPVILYGHSLGGNLAVNFVIRTKPSIDALIVTSPWLKLVDELPEYKKRIAKFIAAIFPLLIVKANINPEYISRDLQEVERYREDKLRHDRMGVRYYFEIRKSGKEAINNKQKINMPFLIMHGTGDLMTSYKASVKMSKNTNTSNTTLKLWDNCYHELHREPERNEVHKFIIDWLDEKVQPKL
jgi:acylglycerol lipase